MKINHVPGIPLRLFPGLTRNPTDGISDYIADNCTVAIFTGQTPSENELWNITDINNYINSHVSQLVHQETCSFKFTYNGYAQKRTIQKWPVVVKKFFAKVDPVTFNKGTRSPYHLNQYQPGTGTGNIVGVPLYPSTFNSSTNLEEVIGIESTGSTKETSTQENGKTVVKKVSLWALIKIPDKDVTQNTTGNDLILFVPNVGTNKDDSIYLSTTEFVGLKGQPEPETTGDINDPVHVSQVELRNITLSYFQSYMITDTVISHEQLNPNNPDQVAVDLVTKKYIYFNKIWGKRISDAYRDCFVSSTTASGYLLKTDPTTNYNINLLPSLMLPNIVGLWSSSLNIGISVSNEYNNILYKYDTVTSKWTTTLLNITTIVPSYAYLINQSLLNIIDEINSKNLNGTLPTFLQAVTNGWFRRSISDAPYATLFENKTLSQFLIKYILCSLYNNDVKNSVRQILVTLGFTLNNINRALDGFIGIDLNPTKFNTIYDQDKRLLTIKNETPSKLVERYNKSVKNITNEQLYLFFPRLNNTQSLYGANKDNASWEYVQGSGALRTSIYSPGNNVSFIDPQKILNGEVLTASTPRMSVYDYTAISIGTIGSNSDLEYEQLDTIDYIDAIYAKVRVPNCF